MILAIDVDGTLIDKQGDWLPGALDSLRWLARRHQIVIHSCRANWHEGRGSLYQLIETAGLQRANIVVHVAAGKPEADIYLDDRAVRFTDWDQAIREIQHVGAR